MKLDKHEKEILLKLLGDELKYRQEGLDNIGYDDTEMSRLNRSTREAYLTEQIFLVTALIEKIQSDDAKTFYDGSVIDGLGDDDEG